MVAEARPLDRFDEFRRTASGAVVPVDVRKLDQAPFNNFRVRPFHLRRFRLCDISCEPVVIERNAGHIREDGVDDGVLMFQLAGEVRIEQADREFVVRAGELAILAANKPYRIVYKRPSRRLFMCVPAEHLKAITGDGAAPPAVCELYKAPIGRVVYALVMSVANEASKLEAEESGLVEDSLMSTLGAFSRRPDDHTFAGLASLRGRDVDAIFEYMESHFTDHNLRPLSIARATNVSLRQLHALVSATGTTVFKWLWERRLQACYEALRNPRHAHQSISEIAYTNGFNDSAHFSRAFRNRFGMAPSRLRTGR